VGSLLLETGRALIVESGGALVLTLCSWGQESFAACGAWAGFGSKRGERALPHEPSAVSDIAASVPWLLRVKHRCSSFPPFQPRGILSLPAARFVPGRGSADPASACQPCQPSTCLPQPSPTPPPPHLPLLPFPAPSFPRRSSHTVNGAKQERVCRLAPAGFCLGATPPLSRGA